MKKTVRLAPRDALARNLKYIKELRKLSDAEVRELAGKNERGNYKVSAKTVNNMYNARTDVQLSNIDAVASVFDITSWHILMPDLIREYESLSDFEQLYNHWSISSKEGRKHILMVAEREATYSKKENE